MLFTNCLKDAVLYPAPNYLVPSPPPEPFEEVYLERPGGQKVHAWSWVPPTEGPLLLFFHGNGENLGTMGLGLLDRFVRDGHAFLAVDYPGYGRSEGSPSLKSVREAGLAAVAHARRKYPDRRLVIAGWSLGAGAAMQTAAASPGEFVALALFSPWASLNEMGGIHFGWLGRKFAGNEYDSRAIARTIRLPVLLVHGREDRVIPFSQGEGLATEFPDQDELRFVPLDGVGHNDLFGERRVWIELDAFLRALR